MHKPQPFHRFDHKYESLQDHAHQLPDRFFADRRQKSQFLNKEYQTVVLEKLRRHIEYGLAKGSLVIKPVPTENGIRTQFIQAGQFFPIEFDGSGNIKKCVFAEQLIKGKYVFTLLEIHTLSNETLTIENRRLKVGTIAHSGQR